jgi:hypothetical protein
MAYLLDTSIIARMAGFGAGVAVVDPAPYEAIVRSGAK